jgi:hypothetical protein
MVMSYVKCFILGLAAFMISGCWTLSIHPLYIEKDVVTDPMLAGKWYSPEDYDQLWIFEEDGDDAYLLTIVEGVEDQLKDAVENESRLVVTVDPDREASFEIHLVRLGEYTVMDFYPEEPENVNEFYKFHVIPAHSFSKVSLEGHVLQISFFDSEWLMDGLDEGGLPINVEEWGDLRVITAETEDLQRFILDNIDEAFDEPQTLHRLE